MVVDYSFYEETFGGNTVPEESFRAFMRKAEAILNRLTFHSIVEEDGNYGQMVRGEFQVFLDKELLAVQYALCNLVDTVAKLEQAEAKALAGNSDASNIRSRSSGGESISYEAVKTAYDVALSDEEKKRALYRDSLLAYMTPTAFRVNPFYAGWR